MKVIELDVKEIMEDFFFCFTSKTDDGNLMRSIIESGICTPLHVIPMKEKYRLLSGFKRFQVALELGLSRIPVTIPSAQMTIEQSFRNVLLEHLTCRTFNLIEKAKVLRILASLQVPNESLSKAFLTILEVPDQLNMVNEIISLLKLSQLAQNYIEMYDLSLKQTKVFSKLTLHQQDILVGLALNLQIRSVEFSEVISMFFDISMRESISLEEVYDRLNIAPILENQDYSRHQKLAQIKERLMDMRYPQLASWNRCLEDLRKKMNLPQKIKLKWDRSLEIPGFELQMAIETTEDIHKINKILWEKENLDRFDEILKIV